MGSVAATAGSLPSIIRNDERLYEGNLIHYFKAVFNRAQNLQGPYHNFRHMLHVTYLCYDACTFYARSINPSEMRSLLIAAMFHDFDHSGMMGNDDLNIARAIRGLEANLDAWDIPRRSTIVSLIRATEYPHAIPFEQLDLYGRIIRDADMAQGLDAAWIQQTVFGLAAERGKKPIEILAQQLTFYANLKFHTEWARLKFPWATIDAKITETRALLDILG